MRWLQAGVLALSAMAMTGCPAEFGKGGRIDKAVERDSQEKMLMLKSCSQQRRQEVCGPGQENSKACLECGGPP